MAFGLTGGMVAFVGGYLGGHLSLVRNIGTAHPDFGRGGSDGDGIPERRPSVVR